MVKKLQKRFAAIIISIFAVVIVGVFVALYISMTSSAKKDAMMTLRKIADFGGFADRPVVNFRVNREEDGTQSQSPFPNGSQPGGSNGSKDNIKFPDHSHNNEAQGGNIYEGIDTITVKYDPNGEIFEVISLIDTGTDVDALNQSEISKIISSGSTDGTVSIDGISYRYYSAERDYGGILVMAPRTEELAVQKRLILMSLTFGTAGMIILIFISIGLSRWIAKPVAEAWSKQQRFVADASHELKTPITVISASLDIISSNKNEAVSTQGRWLDNIRTELERMRQLIIDMLTLAKMDSSNDSLPKSASGAFSRMSLSDTVCDTCLSFESVAFESGKQLCADEIEEGIFINGDEKALHRLTAILVDNALKNSDNNGKIIVTLKRSKNDAVLTCSNTGSGIPKEAIDRIFERFYRADDSRNRETGGFGLGLAIAKAIIDEHKGKITVESIPDKLTSFIARLPMID